ncbi:MAG: hypothetical protein ACRDO0_03680 [Nocardioidaceae bacterium]
MPVGTESRERWQARNAHGSAVYSFGGMFAGGRSAPIGEYFSCATCLGGGQVTPGGGQDCCVRCMNHAGGSNTGGW